MEESSTVEVHILSKLGQVLALEMVRALGPALWCLSFRLLPSCLSTSKQGRASGHILLLYNQSCFPLVMILVTFRLVLYLNSRGVLSSSLQSNVRGCWKTYHPLLELPRLVTFFDCVHASRVLLSLWPLYSSSCLCLPLFGLQIKFCVCYSISLLKVHSHIMLSQC